MMDVVVAGHICLDIIPELPPAPAGIGDLLHPGRLILTGPMTLATGGAVANTGLALHRLGSTTRLMGKIGDDFLGQAVLGVIAAESPGLTEGMLVVPGEQTSYTVILSPPGVDRIFLHCPGANDSFGAADLDPDKLAGARLLHFGYPPLLRQMYAVPDELARLLGRAKAAGLTTSLDLSLPDLASDAGRANWRQILNLALPLTDIVTPNVEELLLTLHRPLFEQLTRAGGTAGLLSQVTPELVSRLGSELLAMGARIVGLKLGHLGFYLRTAAAQSLAGLGPAAPHDAEAWAGRELWSPCFATHVVGTTGSGDATTAGFLYALLRGMAPEAALVAGCAVGACSVEAPDALGGVRDWPATEARINDGWARLPVAVPMPNWRWNNASGVYRGPADKH